MGFGEAIRTCFRKYFTISGRAPRSEYWWFYLFVILASFVAGILDSLLFGADPSGDGGGPLQAILGLATFIPFITAAVRRLHDTGRPGYYIFAPFAFFVIGAGIFYIAPLSGVAIALGALVMVLGVLLQLYWLIQKSDPGDNRYGPNPLMGEHLDQVFE